MPRGDDTHVRGGVTPVSPESSFNHQLTLNKDLESSSSSSSSEKEGKTHDDDADDEELFKLLQAAGITANNRQMLLEGSFLLADVLAELARCHDPGSKVQKPHVIVPMNLIKGDFPNATCYEATYWERHIPNAILDRAGLGEYVQEKVQEERDAKCVSYPHEEDEIPILGGNGKTLIAPDVPDKSLRAWQSAIGQLQLEMPKAAFDTWIRDTELVSVDENVFHIGVQNEYACNWLESRLSATINRLLTGFMNQETTVEFIVL